MAKASGGRPIGGKVRGRGGRPPVALAGEVDARILDAATRLFLERGFEGTSCDQVAVNAGCGKASIYARYDDKSALFRAVMAHQLEAARSVFDDASSGTSPAERLANACIAIVDEALKPEAIGFLRLTIAEAKRFPELVASAVTTRRDRQAASVVAAVTLGKTSSEGLRSTKERAVQVLDSILAPLQMRALLGEDPAALRAMARQSIDGTLLAFFPRLRSGH